jgi:hypothetical protein
MDDKSYYYSFDTLSHDYLFARYELTNKSKQNDSNTIWIFGDSFTQKGGNRSWANYVARNLPGKKVCLINFIPGAPFSPIDQFIQLAHKEKLPPTVIVSSVERALIYRMLNLTLSKDDNLYLKMVNYASPIYPKKNITERCVEYYKKLLGIDNPVSTTELNINAFSYPGGESELLFLEDDLLSIYGTNDMDEAVIKIKDLFQFAKERGTMFIFLACPDKYDMYQNYLVTSSKYIGDNLNTLDYVSERVGISGFFDAKHFLLPNINAGVKDLYYYNDTHWSPKASAIVADSLCKYMN